MIVVNNIGTAGLQSSPHSFHELLRTRGSNVLRDSYILISPQNSSTKTLTAGYTVIYPGCRTAGHAHPEYEEIYHIIKGKGTMKVGEEEFEIKAGDTFLVPFGMFHATFNSQFETLEYFWVLSANHQNIQK